MQQLARWLLGIDVTPDWQSGRWLFEFRSLPTGAAAIGAILLVGLLLAGIWLLYRFDRRDLSFRQRLVLVALRSAILLLAVFMLLELVVVFRQRIDTPAVLAVLVDHSESMGLKDAYSDGELARKLAAALDLNNTAGEKDANAIRERSRRELCEKALERIREELKEGRDYAEYLVGEKLKAVAAGAAPEEKPAGATALGDGLRSILAAYRGRPFAGIVLFSDGRSNAGEDPLKVAEQAKAAGVPLYTVAVGSSDGPRNLRIADVETNPVVFVRDPIQLSVLVESTGLKGTPVTVMLEQSKDGAPWTQVGKQEILLEEDGLLQRSPFSFTPGEVGQYNIRARVSDVGPELSTDDNMAAVSVKVIRQEIRVLLIAGAPSFEMQFLRNALRRDQAVEFASWLQHASRDFDQIGSKPIRRLPVNQEELDHYDVLLLVDPDMAALPSGFSEMIVKFVGDSGGGLIYVAGEMFSDQLFGATGGGPTEDASWLKVLPVVRDPGLYRSAAEVALSSRNAWTLEVTPEGHEDPVFHFDENPVKNREIIASLPGMYWHFPVTRAKPGAVVLARHGDPRMQNQFGRHVLLATHLYGPGRTVFIGFDSTYRWRYLSESYFDGFWARLVDRVGRAKVLGGRHPLRLATDKAAYRIGDRVKLSARFVNAADAASAGRALVGEVEIAGRPPQPLSLDPAADDPAVFEADFPANDAGVYLVRVNAGSEATAESGPRSAVVSFRVAPPISELDNPTVHRALLEELARRTGGRAFSLAEFASLPASIPIKTVERTIEQRDEIWDAPLIFGGFLLLLTLEWILRKWWRLA